ncbi:MAG TPA: ABC transporter permease [Acidimicrobiales bacterium]|jgi:ABC-2 type transport system permease protein|nr:ABC transporter permease [Acidimicrobiales bacterium]
MTAVTPATAPRVRRGHGAAVYTKYELLRTIRNRRFFIFTLAFPLILYVTVAGPNRHAKALDGVPFVLYYLSGMVAWGTMGAVVAGGGRIALEREVGWNRQLRVTPLSVAAYFRAKVLSSYTMAALTIALLSIVATSYGVSLSAGRWAEMIGLVLLGLIPFTILGIMLGHLLNPDAFGPVMGGGTAILSLLSGAFGPILSHGALLEVVKCLPSYWLVQAGHAAVTGGGWPLEGWIVVTAWTVVLLGVAARVYLRDTGRA